MKKIADIRERIAIRAYFVWLAGSTAGAAADWLEAEAIETALAERRTASAVKAAATRRAKGFYEKVVKLPPAEMLVAVASRPTCRPTAH